MRGVATASLLAVNQLLKEGHYNPEPGLKAIVVSLLSIRRARQRNLLLLSFENANSRP